MSDYGNQPADDPRPDPAGGSTAFDPTRDPWARPLAAGSPGPVPGPPLGSPPLGEPGSQPPTFPGPGWAGSPPVPNGQPAYEPPAYGQPLPPYGQPPPAYAVPGYPGGYFVPAAQSSGRATTVLVLGIASLVLLLLCGIGIVPAVISLAMSGGAKREIEQSQGRLGGLGMVTAGRVTSWVTIALFAIAAVVLVIGLAINPGSGGQYNGF